MTDVKNSGPILPVVAQAGVLVLDRVAKTYGEGPTAKEVLKEVSLAVNPGEFVCVVGHSGAGKTTLLKSMCGLLKPTSGAIYFEGKRVDSPPEHLAVVFQDYSRSLMPWMTVGANVQLPLRNDRSITQHQRSERARRALAAVGLANCFDMYPWQLSGGMQQRAAIARAIACEPSLLLMDEPFASVDAQTRAELEDLILDVHRSLGMTIVLVTHDIDEAVYLADRVALVMGSPSSVAEVVVVDIPRPRDQVASKENPEFARLRSHILKLVRSH